MLPLAKIKLLYHRLPNSLKRPLVAMPYSMFLGSTYTQTLNFLNYFALLSSDEQKSYCENALLEYLNLAIHDTPYYIDFAKSRGWSKIDSMHQFLEFPIITKDQLTTDLDWFVPKHIKSKYIVTTGGTSGKQTQLYMSNEAFRKEWAFKAELLSNRGVNINSRRICLKGVDFYGETKATRLNPLYKELIISPFKLSQKYRDEIVDAVQQFCPTWIHGYPSSVSQFASLIDDTSISSMNFDASLLVSETVTDGQIRTINDVFGSNIISFYGMTERVIFAPREVSGMFSPHMAYGFTEEQNHQLIGTGFLNSATRLIRYNTGDEVVVRKDGPLVTEICSIVGRWGSEHLVGKSGARITMTALNIHSNQLDFISRYQFFQTIPGHCELRIILDEHYNSTKSDLEKVRMVFQHKVQGELEIELQVVDDIPLTPRGKHQFVVSSVK